MGCCHSDGAGVSSPRPPAGSDADPRDGHADGADATSQQQLQAASDIVARVLRGDAAAVRALTRVRDEAEQLSPHATQLCTALCARAAQRDLELFLIEQSARSAQFAQRVFLHFRAFPPQRAFSSAMRADIGDAAAAADPAADDRAWFVAAVAAAAQTAAARAAAHREHRITTHTRAQTNASHPRPQPCSGSCAGAGSYRPLTSPAHLLSRY
jgi:hypothetical protein